MGDPTQKENDTKTNTEDGVVDEDIEINENEVEEVIIEDDNGPHSGETLTLIVAKCYHENCPVFISNMMGFPLFKQNIFDEVISYF